MSTISTLGPVGYNPTGEYDATKTYEKLDVVIYNGSSYVAISDSIGQLPTNTTYWNLIAKKGDTGDTGESGNGIVSFEKTSTVGLIDTYTITYTNGDTDTLTVTNGEDGDVTQAQLDAVQKEVDYNELIEKALPIITGSGTDITITNTIDTILKLVLNPSELTQSDIPTPTNPQTVHRVTGTNRITVSSSTNRVYWLQLNLGNIEYCKLGNYADKFYKATSDDAYLQAGKWYLIRRIGRLDLNGYENWTLRNLTDTNLYFSTDEIEYSVDATKTGLSSHFAYVSDLDSNDNPGFNFVTEANHLRIRIPKTLLSDVSTESNAINSFKDWLSANSVIIYYIYPASVSSLLPDYPFNFQDSLTRIYEFSKSYQGQTKIEQTNEDSPFVIDYTTFLGITSEDIENWNSKQDALVSGTNLKTVTNKSLLGSGNISIDYDDLDDKPSINSVELGGNKSLSDLGIQPAGNYVVDNDYVHTDNNYTTSEKTKLAGLENYDDTNVVNDLKRVEMMYNALPKVTASATDITLNDTVECPMELELESNIDQVTTTGKNFLNVESNYTFTGVKVITSLISSIPAGTYVISCNDVVRGSTNYPVLKINNTNTFLTSDLSSSITIPSEVSSAYFYANGGSYSDSTGVTSSIQNLMISANGGDYEPYTNGPSPNPSYPQAMHVITGDNTIKIQNKNIFNPNWFQLRETNGITATIKNNCLVLNGTSTGNVYIDFSIPSGSFKDAGNYWYVKSDKNLGNLHIDATGTTGTGSINITPTTNWTKTSYVNTYVSTGGYIYVASGVTLDNCKVYIDVREKNIDLTDYVYQEHLEQVFTIPLGDLEYCKIGDYSDKFFKNTINSEEYDNTLELNKWYLKKNFGKVVLDGVNNVVFPNDTNANSYLYNFSLNHLKGEAKSNYFTHIDSYPSSTGSGGKFNSTKTSSTIYFGGYGIVSGDNATLRSATEFNTWLSTHNTTVYYPLATPTYTLLNDTLQTELDNLQYALSYQGQTNISQTNQDLSFIVNAKAVYDINKLVTRVEVLESEV